MRISMKTDHNWSERLVQLAHTRLQFALGRFASRISSLRVRLRDTNGPRGGIDKQCLVTIRLDRDRRPIVITEEDEHAVAAICRAAERAGRAVARSVELQRWQLPEARTR